MLNDYYYDPQTLERYRTGPAGEYLDEFIVWLEGLGFRYCSIRFIVRGANAFARWAQRPIEALDADALCAFGRHLDTESYLQYPSGPYNHHYVSARHFIHFLEASGRVPLPAPTEPAADEPALWYAFCDWMRTQRGTMEVTLKNYRLSILALIQTLGDQPTQFNAKALREFVLERAQQQSVASAKNMVTAVRMMVRFLIATGRCKPGLDHALPTIARWRLAALPKYLPAEEVERIIASCNLTTLIGIRDRAVLLLLARLGLRAGDVATLMFEHIDWQNATLQVAGKNRRAERLPLAQEVGDAIIDYLQQRPALDGPYVFITTRYPFKGLSYQTVSQIATQAMQRAGVSSPIHGAHLLRHSAACEMLRQGLSLPTIGALLRHRSIETTTTYAKIDTALLGQVTRPWPEEASC